MRIKGLSRSLMALGATAIVTCAVPALGTGASAASSGSETVHESSVKDAHSGSASTTNNLYYHGGNPGVETLLDKVYIVWWGSQWNGSGGVAGGNDPSGEAAIQTSFFGGVGGSGWNNSVTQYCEGETSGSFSCNGGTPATNPSGVFGGGWYDNGSAAPKRPSQSQLAAEAVRAAAHFGNPPNTEAQYVVSTATHNSASGFGSRYCAWHSSTTSTLSGTIAYTNMPYITDAGASCGANFVNSGSAGLTDGITIVGGHEFGETETDIFPSGGWLDSSGAENGDKCAWISSGQGAAANVTFGGGTYPVQSLWSNATSNCVLSY